MLAGDTEVRARVLKVEEMLRQICEPEEFPLFVSDEATVLDVCTLPLEDITERLGVHYGRRVSIGELQLPIWRLAERLSPSH